MGGLIKIAIERPVAVLALILLTVLFGILRSPFSRFALPGQAPRRKM